MSDLAVFAIIIGVPCFIAGLLIGAAIARDARDEAEPTEHGARPL